MKILIFTRLMLSYVRKIYYNLFLLPVYLCVYSRGIKVFYLLLFFSSKNTTWRTLDRRWEKGSSQRQEWLWGKYWDNNIIGYQGRWIFCPSNVALDKVCTLKSLQGVNTFEFYEASSLKGNSTENYFGIFVWITGRKCTYESWMYPQVDARSYEFLQIKQ